MPQVASTWTLVGGEQVVQSLCLLGSEQVSAGVDDPLYRAR